MCTRVCVCAHSTFTHLAATCLGLPRPRLRPPRAPGTVVCTIVFSLWRSWGAPLPRTPKQPHTLACGPVTHQHTGTRPTHAPRPGTWRRRTRSAARLGAAARELGWAWVKVLVPQPRRGAHTRCQPGWARGLVFTWPSLSSQQGQPCGSGPPGGPGDKPLTPAGLRRGCTGPCSHGCSPHGWPRTPALEPGPSRSRGRGGRTQGLSPARASAPRGLRAPSVREAVTLAPTPPEGLPCGRDGVQRSE